MKLNPGDKLFLDFDGIIVENINPITKSPYYPEIGPIKEGIKELLDNCNKNKIEVEIWSARTNTKDLFINEKDFPIFGQKGVEQIIKFMNKNNLFFTCINVTHKPLGCHKGAAKFFLDDHAGSNIKDIEF